MSLGYVPLNATVALRQTVTNDWGELIPTDEEKLYRVRLDYNIMESRLSIANGSERIIKGSVLFVGNVDIGETDLLVIDGKEYNPVQVTPITDLANSVLHTKVLF